MKELEIAKAIKNNGYSCAGLDFDCHQCPFDTLDCGETPIEENWKIVDKFIEVGDLWKKAAEPRTSKHYKESQND